VLQCGEAEMCCGGQTHIGVGGHMLGCSDMHWGWVDTCCGVRTWVGDGWTQVGVGGHKFGMGGHRFTNPLRSS
jgi:hypothetical protein